MTITSNPPSTARTSLGSFSSSQSSARGCGWKGPLKTVPLVETLCVRRGSAESGNVLESFSQLKIMHSVLLTEVRREYAPVSMRDLARPQCAEGQGDDARPSTCKNHRSRNIRDLSCSFQAHLVRSLYIPWRRTAPPGRAQQVGAPRLSERSGVRARQAKSSAQRRYPTLSARHVYEIS